MTTTLLFVRALGLGALLALASQPAFALPPTPAHWTVSGLPSKPVAPGTAFTLQLQAHIDPGWHIYALEEPDDGPVATEIGLAAGDPLALLNVDEPSARMVPDPTSHRDTGMFTGEVTFTLHLRAPRKAMPGATSHILVRYQSCNDQICLPPHTETLPLPLTTLLR